MKKTQVVKEYKQYDVVLNILIGILFITITMVGDLYIAIVLILSALSLHESWLKKNNKSRDVVLQELVLKGYKSQENYNAQGDHLLFKVDSFMKESKGTQSDLAASLAYLADVEAIYIMANERLSLVGKWSEVIILSKHYYHAEFRNKETNERIPLGQLIFMFNENVAQLIHADITKDNQKVGKNTNA